MYEENDLIISEGILRLDYEPTLGHPCEHCLTYLLALIGPWSVGPSHFNFSGFAVYSITAPALTI